METLNLDAAETLRVRRAPPGIVPAGIGRNLVWMVDGSGCVRWTLDRSHARMLRDWLNRHERGYAAPLAFGDAYGESFTVYALPVRVWRGRSRVPATVRISGETGAVWLLDWNDAAALRDWLSAHLYPETIPAIVVDALRRWLGAAALAVALTAPLACAGAPTSTDGPPSSRTGIVVTGNADLGVRFRGSLSVDLTAEVVSIHADTVAIPIRMEGVSIATDGSDSARFAPVRLPAGDYRQARVTINRLAFAVADTMTINGNRFAGSAVVPVPAGGIVVERSINGTGNPLPVGTLLIDLNAAGWIIHTDPTSRTVRPNDVQRAVRLSAGP